MSANTDTYKSLLWSTALACGLNPNSAAGGLTLTPEDNFRLTSMLNDAMRWAMLPGNPNVCWPELLTTAQITLTNSSFDSSLVDYQQRFVLWSTDPRTLGSQGYKVTWVQDGSTIRPQDASLATVFALYQPRPAQFTITAWSNVAAYALDDLVYLSTDGNCYRCTNANTGNTPPNASYWVVQDCLSYLSIAVTSKTESYFRSSLGETDKSAKADDQAQYELDRAWKTVKNAAPSITSSIWITHALWR